MHAQHMDDREHRESGPPRWRRALEERARSALGALHPALARAAGSPRSDDERAGAATPHARDEQVTVIPAAAHSASAERWRALFARMHRPGGQSHSQAQSQAQGQPQAQQDSVPLLPAPWFRAARRWSPGLFPPLLALALVGALVLIGHLAGRGPAIVPPADILPLALIYLIGGTLYGVALYYAPTNNVWLTVLTGGGALYILATLWVLAGPLAVAALVVLLAVPVYFYVRHHLHTVPAGQAVVTTLAGGYHRTLAPGTTVLVPGERPLASVDTGDRQLALPGQRVRVTDPDGEGFVARAAATLAYHVAPAHAHLAALGTDDWEQDLRECAAESLRAALGAWGRRLLEGDQLPERFLARTTLDDLRPRVRPNGVTILWVNVRDIWLTPQSEVIPVAEWEGVDVDAAPADDAEVDDDTDVGAVNQTFSRPYADPPTPRPVPQGSPPAPAPSAALPPIDDPRSGLADSEPLVRDMLDPDALADAYDAVRDGHITDPETIREIARAFMAVAADPELAESFPYNAAAAAQILMERASALERAALGRGNLPH